MNVAEETIDWLAGEQFRIDDRWSYLVPTGFTWWPDQYAQTVEIVREQTGPRGETGYLVCVRTELLRDLDLTDSALAEINALSMRCASMSGPVYDAAARRLDLWSMARMHDDNGPWMRHLIAAAAVTQIAEARSLAQILAERTGALPATSGHPEGGLRTSPDRILSAAVDFVGSGEEPCAWTEDEFSDTVGRHMIGIPGATAAGRGFTVDIPFGAETSRLRVTGDQPHPLYGNGLLVLQRFPVRSGSEAEGIRLALSLNAADLTREHTGYGFGSYAYADGDVYFTGFVPNALHRPGLLANLYHSGAARVQAMAARFVEGGWDPEAYSLDAAVLARRQAEREAARPAAEPAPRGCPVMRAKTGGN